VGRPRQTEPPVLWCGECERDILPHEPVYRQGYCVDPEPKECRHGFANYVVTCCAGCAVADHAGWHGRHYWLPPEPCAGCGRQVFNINNRRQYQRTLTTCCPRCYSRAARLALSRKAEPSRHKTCPVCGQAFQATRTDARTCSSACKQKAYRQRKHAGVTNFVTGSP
jgi:predicted nucleic acid-binding Zn ribbon protein